MIISYLRSSSYNCHDFCGHQYFLDYVLGIKPYPNIKTIKGSIVHHVLEAIANAKRMEQDNLPNWVDDWAGEISILRRPDETQIQDLSDVVQRVYDRFTKIYPQLDWDIDEYKDCYNWSVKVLQDKTFSPLVRKIVAAEQKFDFPIKKPWSNFRYESSELPAGIGPIEGQLALKGTIDLITEIEPGVLEMIDWKTGRRFDWGKKEVKDYHKLLHDPQLRIYHYVLSHLFPDAKQILITIYFINDGGAYTIPFNKKDIIETEGLLKEKFFHIKRTIRPKLNKGWHCTKFCYFGRHNMQGKKTTDENNTICAHIHNELHKKGMDNVVKEYTVPGFSVNNYSQGE